jgi:hypothetical protein
LLVLLRIWRHKTKAFSGRIGLKIKTEGALILEMIEAKMLQWLVPKVHKSTPLAVNINGDTGFHCP